MALRIVNPRIRFGRFVVVGASIAIGWTVVHRTGVDVSAPAPEPAAPVVSAARLPEVPPPPTEPASDAVGRALADRPAASARADLEERVQRAMARGEEERVGRHAEAYWQRQFKEKRGIVARQYAFILDRLGLDPALREWVVDRMAELRLVSLDVRNSAEALGVYPLANDRFNEAVKAAQNVRWEEIARELGEERYADFRRYNDTLQERGMVNRLNAQLAAATAGMGLTETQVEHLTAALYDVATIARRTEGQSPMSTMIGAEGRSWRMLAALEAIAEELNPATLTALQHIVEAENVPGDL